LFVPNLATLTAPVLLRHVIFPVLVGPYFRLGHILSSLEEEGCFCCCLCCDVGFPNPPASKFQMEDRFGCRRCVKSGAFMPVAAAAAVAVVPVDLFMRWINAS
jgi:hypothetical protein